MIPGSISPPLLLGVPPSAAPETVQLLPTFSYDPFIAINPAETKIYVTGQDGLTSDGTVWVLDSSSFATLTTIAVGNNPTGIAINAAGTFALVCNNNDGTVSRINIATDTVTNTITVANGVAQVAINPAGTKAYVTNGSNNIVSIINIGTNAVTGTFALGDGITFSGMGATGIVTNSTGTQAWIACYLDNAVALADLGTDTWTLSVAVSTPPAAATYVAITPDNSKVYVACSTSGEVSVVDAVGHTETATVSISSATCLTVDSSGTHVYVTGPSLVSRIVIGSNTVDKTYVAGSGTQGLITYASGTKFICCNSGDGTLTAGST